MTADQTRALCECPFLRMHALTERMAGCGIVRSETETAGEWRVAAVAVGMLRQAYGCSGPTRDGLCPYRYEMGTSLKLDPDVPLLKRDDNRPGTYL